jgi:hypothetical protein
VSRRRALIAVALVLVGLMTAAFAMRGIQHARRLHARAQEPLQPWMTVPYIARVYRIHPDTVHQVLGLPQGQRDRRPLSEIARAQGRPVSALIADLNVAIQREREARRPPGKKPPPQSTAGP